MGRLFGTDGVRGVANEELTPVLAMQLGQAGAYVLTRVEISTGKRSISPQLWWAVIPVFPAICLPTH